MRKYKIMNAKHKGVVVPEAECEIVRIAVDSKGVAVHPQWYAITREIVDGEENIIRDAVAGDNFRFDFVPGPVDIMDQAQQAFLTRFPNATRIV